MELYNTTHPTREMVEQNKDLFEDDRPRAWGLDHRLQGWQARRDLLRGLFV